MIEEHAPRSNFYKHVYALLSIPLSVLSQQTLVFHFNTNMSLKLNMRNRVWSSPELYTLWSITVHLEAAIL